MDAEVFPTKRYLLHYDSTFAPVKIEACGSRWGAEIRVLTARLAVWATGCRVSLPKLEVSQVIVECVLPSTTDKHPSHLQALLPILDDWYGGQYSCPKDAPTQTLKSCLNREVDLPSEISVEVTPEMIEAGVLKTVPFESVYDFPEEAVVRIYRAMFMVSPLGRLPQSSRELMP